MTALKVIRMHTNSTIEGLEKGKEHNRKMGHAYAQDRECDKILPSKLGMRA